MILNARRISASFVLQLRFNDLLVFDLGHFQKLGSLHNALGMPGKNAKAIGSNTKAAYLSANQSHIGTPFGPLVPGEPPSKLETTKALPPLVRDRMVSKQ